MPSLPKSKILSNLSVLIALSCVTFFSFFPSLKNNFIDWDDRVHLLDNPYVRDAGAVDIIGIFTSTVNHTYIPLTTLSHAIEYSLFGFNPFLFHLNNLLLHIGVAALVYWFFLRLNYSIVTAGLAALIFAVHPMRVESVAWITERKDVLYGLFFMLSLVCYLKYIDKKNFSFYWLSVLLGLLSMMSKAMALTLPAALLICDWHQKRKWSASLFVDKIPYLLYILPLTWVTWAKVSVIYSVHPDVTRSVLTGIWTFAFYPSKFMWPVSLSPAYYLPEPVSLFEWAYFKSSVILILFGLLCVFLRKNRAFMFAVAFYLISAPFIIRFNAVPYNGEIVAADRYIYLSSIGFCLLLGHICEKIYHTCRDKGVVWRRGWSVLVSLLLGGLTILTYQQCKIWKDTQSLMTRLIHHYPTTDIAYNNRAIAYMRDKQNDLALADLNRAIEYNPQKPRYYNNRANIYTMMGQYDSALEDFNKVIELKPDHFVAFYNRGSLYIDMGRYDLAIEDFNEALKIKPDYREAYRNRLFAMKRINKE